MKRIGIAGFLHESNTFLPVATTYEHFASTSLTKGGDLLRAWRASHHELGGFLEGAARYGFEPVPLMATFAVPSGALTPEAFERIAAEMVESLRAAMPLDGLLVALHGATVSTSFPDADGEMLARLRAVTGPDLPIVNTLDLHANISERMVAGANATVVYRSNPHLDQKERGLEAAALMDKILRGEARPVQALAAPPLVIQISRQYTSEQPAQGLYDDVREVLTWPGILSASVAMGFYYSDVEEMGASFLAVADGDPALARRAADWMATRAWQRREEFIGRLPSPEEAVRLASQSAETPVALMDVGDNVGGGSPADSTILFAEILHQKVPNALVILYDPESVEQCVAAGVRATVDLRVGGKTDDRHGAPVAIRGRVRTISDGYYVETQVRHGGWGRNDQGVTVVVETEDQHTVILTSRRMAPMSLEQVLSLGIHPERKKLLIVKGVVAPRAAYAPVSAKILLVDTPGVTGDDPAQFHYQHRRTALYPLERDAEWT
ncbi:MAG TPA: M81 family metallopeptidase [Bryobacteraceae bacterium]|jgi:microcystin degradation protein MlrC|nr:M81 family metallopeptidase [Bryobacteraceae bacterium]